jgi:creatinine amidohydrolase/Fe(II)-dependent formamide hydrolase-like protein
MRKLSIAPAALMLSAMAAASLLATAPAVAATKPTHLVEFEKMTWAEVKQALADGKTTALIYTGGVEQRGPQDANGGHNEIAYGTVQAIAQRLGNAIFLPVLPYTPNEAEAALPGTIGITDDLLGAILERISEQAIVNGFKNVVIMGDHGGGQPKVYQEVAKKLNDQYSSRGIHIYYCDQVYFKVNNDFEKYLADHGYPQDEHGGISDTSEMLYLDKDHTWVRRDLLPTAVGDLYVDGKAQVGPNSPHNGITGDARRASAALGKVYFDMKVDYAVKQIRGFIGGN